MGFWDKVKSVANSAKCMTGWHAGEYNHIYGMPECHLEKICPDCDKYVTKIKHNFNDWRYTNNSFSQPCDSVRTCIHCEEQETKVIHQYEKNGKDSNCRVVEKCKRCGDEQLKSASHNWISIAGHDLKVQGKRKCKDCGTVEDV